MPLQSPHTHSVQKRCAIYTRKSSVAGLGFELNSLEMQRQVCQAYIQCQAHKNWIELPHRYDDGGISGGTLERPALRRLISDIEAGRVDTIVVYKIDRLSRSLPDFVRLIDLLDRYGATFVSVTQTFDTSDSMGRLVLNVLLTFAQFERELASDRSRDKKAALARRGFFTGGTPPFGYLVGRGGKLTVDPERAEVVREMFQRFPDVSANELSRDFKSRGLKTRIVTTATGRKRGGWPLWPKQIMKILSNPIYTGHIIHRGDWIAAKVEPLVSREQWELVQEVKRNRFPQRRDPVQNFLLGILHDHQGRPMRIFRGVGRSRASRYYKSNYASWSRDGVTRRVMVDADRVEQLALSAIKSLLVDRIRCKEAILSLGRYSDEVGQMLRRAPTAARLLDAMDPTHLRPLMIALVPRAEVTTSELTLYLSCLELSRFLAWDRVGVFSKSEVMPSRAADLIYVVHAPAFLICGHPRFALPIDPCTSSEVTPKASLVQTLRRAAELREFVLANRTKSIRELAREKGIGPSTFARILRLNYLAPDIQAAIVDGTQPETLKELDLLYGAMPLDWEQQRQLFGFVS